MNVLSRILIRTNQILIKLAQRIVPPQVTVFDHIGGIGNTLLLQAAARLKIADLLDQSPMTATQLAERLKTHPEATYRVMRALVTLGFFQLTRDGYFKNNRFSKVLISNSVGSMKNFAEYFGSHSNVLAWSDILETVMTGSNAFDRTHQMSIWEWFKKNPKDGEVFADAMANLTQLEAPAIASAYPFDEIQTLCDVAGGRGTFLAEVLRQHSHLKATLFDEEYVIQKAKDFLKHSDSASRVRYESGSFFTKLPSHTYDAYFLKDILHDWDDDTCRQILVRIRQSMKAESRLLIAETLVEPASTQKPGPLMDVHMMAVCRGGRQRSREEFVSLLEKSGFRLQRVFKTPFPVSILEGIPT